MPEVTTTHVCIFCHSPYTVTSDKPRSGLNGLCPVCERAGVKS